VRELGVTALRFWVLRHGVIAASRGGKLKTLVQSIAIGLYVLPLTAWAPNPLVDWVRWWLMGLAVVAACAAAGRGPGPGDASREALDTDGGMARLAAAARRDPVLEDYVFYF